MYCRTCVLTYARTDGIYILAPSFFALNGSPPRFYDERMRQLLLEAGVSGWDEARRRFTAEILAGRLRAPASSRWARLGAKLTGATWEDLLQDLVDSTRAGWKFLLDLRPGTRALFLGPSWGAAPCALATSCALVEVLDGSLERLQLVRHQALGAGLDNLAFARVVDPLRLPLADGSVDLVVVPGLAQWFAAVAGKRPQPPSCGTELLAELRRVLAPNGQVYLATDNRSGVSALFLPRRPRGATYSPGGLRAAATAARFAACRLFAPVPFRHKFHQIVDIQQTEGMNISADAYRTRGSVLRPLVRVWDRCNRDGALERRLYPWLPGVSAVLSTDPASEPFAERLVHHLLGANGHGPAPGAPLSRYFVRPKGVAVLVVGEPDSGGLVVRLPLDARAASSCGLHHRALEALAADTRLPVALRALFPTPIAQGCFEGQTFFAESALAGESGRRYYSRSGRRYDRAIANAAEVLRELRRSTEQPVLLDAVEFERLCGRWLGELHGLVREESRPTLDAVARWLERTLLGATLPFGWHHGDYDFANLLYGPGDAVRGILDFEVFDGRGLPLIDLMCLLARRPIRRQRLAFGTLFVRSILARRLPPLETGLLEREIRFLGADEQLYRALALCCWLNHLRLRRDGWLVRSPSWLDDNLHAVVENLRRLL